TILEPRREARVRAGPRGHESAANRRDLRTRRDPPVSAHGRGDVRTSFARDVFCAGNGRADGEMRVARSPAGFLSPGWLVEIVEESAELGEAFWPELLCPGGLHFADRFADDLDRGGAAWGEGDALGAEVVGIRSALEVVEALELAEQVVERLFA